MSVNKNQVEQIAKLARLKFDENEIENLTKDMNKILDYMDQLNELDTDNIEPLSHPLDLSNVMREDNLKESISREEVFKNAPSHNEEFFKVPKVINK
ncbi:MAG: Asp-tRNA(Asn)/Glu-tRNA(Gln) amidotransferase subunit GatC [Melioribacteraceae bacterium]|jgi:aspartyl-tRNA(Asn)/glutamyl-tRNA(Gln) amidotransferase subunit C|nr:Asp-tRNA(Asn)/Glu-tRNA(Gln) amidotransferase subunit GatC [Melioribacteraceae bacterium]